MKRRAVCRPRVKLEGSGTSSAFWLGVATSLLANVVTIIAVEMYRASKRTP